MIVWFLWKMTQLSWAVGLIVWMAQTLREWEHNGVPKFPWEDKIQKSE